MLMVPSSFMNIYHVSVVCHCYKHVIHALISALTLCVFSCGFLCRVQCVCMRALHCLTVTGVQVTLSMSDAKVTCTYTLLPYKPGYLLSPILVSCSPIQQSRASVHQAGNEGGALRRSQPTDKDVLIDLVLSLSVSPCNFITIKWRLHQITGAAASLWH